MDTTSIPDLTALPGDNALVGLAVALGVGLLIGIERERRKGVGAAREPAGVRTFSLIALCGAVAALLHPLLPAVVLVSVAGLTVLTRRGDPNGERGLTSEVAMLLTILLGALAPVWPALAASLGVVVAVLLAAKGEMHRFSREVLTEREVHDGLMLAAAALVILPLLPDQGYGPDGAFNPHRLWRLLVMLLAVGMGGHFAQRLFGARLGLAISGFFAGLASSTAATAAFGGRVNEPGQAPGPLASATLLANLSSLFLSFAVVGSLSMTLLRAAFWPLLAAAVALLLGAMLGVRRNQPDGDTALTASAFRLGHAAMLAVAIGAVLWISALAGHWFGERGAIATAVLAAFAELQASTATIAQLANTGGLSMQEARVGLLLLLAAASTTKTIVAAVSGGRAYALRVGGGLAFMLAMAFAALALPPPG